MTHSKQVSARGLLILFVLMICVGADQLSKRWALTNLTHGIPEPFIPGFIRFTLTANPGAAFSIGSQNGQIMGVVATVLSLVILAWVVKRTLSNAPLPVVEQIGMGCLLGGAVGNLIDRYTRGQVTDFLEFAFVSFPVFNVADALIDVGIGCLFIAMYCCKTEDNVVNKELSTPTDEGARGNSPGNSASDNDSNSDNDTSSDNGTSSDSGTNSDSGTHSDNSQHSTTGNGANQIIKHSD
ncbi:MAG: signal peptidase II [Candidatus Melainabacteria bacterium]|nr:signal peptidase II [Candidatus Melainabacteria bacterium]